MKKNILPVVFTILFSGPALSQGWRIAPTLGLNVSAISYSTAFRNNLNSNTTSTSTGPMARFQVGALLDYAFSDRFSIRSGLLYMGKGGSLRVTTSRYGLTETGRATYQIDYLEIPFLLNLAVGTGGYRLVGGPVFGLALSAKSVAQASTGYSLASQTTQYKIGSTLTDQVLPTDLSVSLGVVRELELGNRPLEIGLHVQPSFSNWNTVSKTRSDYYAKNLLVGLRVSYLFELRR